VQVVPTIDKPGDQERSYGPSGFLELGGNVLVVDFGKVFLEDTVVGFLFEDGLLKNGTSEGEDSQWRLLDDLEGCVFRGIDSSGVELVIPVGEYGGPTGKLVYNGQTFNVLNGRIATEEHMLVGEFDDTGKVTIRDRHTKVARRELDESAVLNLYFEGVRSDGSEWKYEYVRPLSRKDKSYAENEIIRYFQDFDRLSMLQKKYVVDSMQIWASSGILQVVRKSEGNAALGNVKHGAAGVTRVRTGMVDLDVEEFDRDIDLFKRFGALAVVSTRIQPYVEVRINLVVSHEFGHQLQFCLSQALQDRIDELYRARLKRSIKMCPTPNAYEGGSELLRPEYVPNRMFVSGYAKASKFEYWAESVAAFSVPEGRRLLRELDPAIHKILTEVVFHPETAFTAVLSESILDLQSSLRVGGEFKEDLLNC
jgi:hypothetical protein